ncbi:anthranilate phosphoribosyltransferase [Buchnera aphidicola]|uniref:anthranilate phosphoribosyltransferase n=1 Tax=Buchnera aphidicola TaxID=9 RepID=UPI0022389B1B|nr:anthranilate phosphoribosyltransferase [Buchnera aphidicola]MCW5197690.1 anthranilate phosphoribosyltransferase [Buchnera aphidicola (Chaitophorus viminalis)]
MKKILNKLLCSKNLQKTEMYKLMLLIGKKKINLSQISSIITAIKIKGIKKREILGLIQASWKLMKKFPKQKCKYSDIAGTGGDSSNGINISTSSALIAALLGFKIIKHCNESITSSSGSSNILQCFNINTQMSIESSKQMFNKFNICFLNAQKYNPIFKHVHQVRSELKIRTFFNIAGPLLNPSQPKLGVIGTYSKDIMFFMAKIIQKMKYKKIFLINSDKTDEATLYKPTYLVKIKNKKITSKVYTPSDFGLSWRIKKNIEKRSLQDNFKILKKIFKGKGSDEDNELIAINTSILLKIFGNKNLKKNTIDSLKILHSGKIYNFIKNISRVGEI